MFVKRISYTSFKFSAFLILAGLLFVSSCIQCPNQKNYRISQVGRFSNFIQGDYDGKVSLDKLSDYGNFGVGTFDGLDGELVALDGFFYKIPSNGKVLNAKKEKNQSIPYATVHFFNANNTVYLDESLNFKELEEVLDRVKSDQNKVYAFKISGNFNYLKLRSPKIQSKPYRKLKEIIDHQPIFEHKNIDGTLVGYFTPSKFGDVLIPGYHFHFISKDKKVGGHVLDMNLSNAKLQIDQIDLDKINILAE